MEHGRPVTRRQFITGPAGARQSTEGDAARPSLATETPYLVRYARPAMACDFQLFLVAGRDDQGAEAALAALDVVEQIESQLTVYRDTSELLDLNRRAAAEPVVVESRMYDLIERAVALSRETGGAFDPTSGPLSQVWGFSRRQGRIPDDAELAAARATIGAQNVQLNREARTVRFLRARTEINLNAVGKGYALDRCREVLADFGVSDFLLHGGQSSVLAGGSPQRNASGVGTAWSVGIGHPLRPERRLAELYVSDRAVGTSGAGFQFFRHAGKRYGHILDPRTGRPADGVFSVTVVAPQAAEADALSTAFYVMGCAAAEQYCAHRPEIGFLMLLPSAGGGAIELFACNLDDDAWQLFD